MPTPPPTAPASVETTALASTETPAPAPTDTTAPVPTVPTETAALASTDITAPAPTDTTEHVAPETSALPLPETDVPVPTPPETAVAAEVPLPPPPSPTDGDHPGLEGEEEAYEHSTLSGAGPRPHGPTGPDTDAETEADQDADSDADSSSDSEDEGATPPWADPAWLSTVFGPQWNRAPRVRLQETSEALYALVEDAAGTRPPGAGLTDLTRQVLHLPARSRVTGQDMRDLGALALEASSDDLASAEDLALYFVDRQIETRRDALAEETLLRGEDSTPAGRDLTGAGRGMPDPGPISPSGPGRRWSGPRRGGTRTCSWGRPPRAVASRSSRRGAPSWSRTPWRWPGSSRTTRGGPVARTSSSPCPRRSPPVSPISSWGRRAARPGTRRDRRRS